MLSVIHVTESAEGLMGSPAHTHAVNLFAELAAKLMEEEPQDFVLKLST
jgi:hypothetical protein